MSIKYNGKVIAGNYKTQIISGATQETSGIIKIATEEEITIGLDNSVAVTPLYLSGKQDKIIDTNTVVVDEKGLNALGVLEKNTGNAVFDWIGTLEEWQLGRDSGEIPDTYICFITND